MSEVGGTALGSYVLSRMMLYWRVDAARLQAWLQPPWRAVTDEEGNLALGFVRVLAAFDRQDRALPTCWFAPFNWDMVNEETGARSGVTYQVFSSAIGAPIGWFQEGRTGPTVAEFWHRERTEDRAGERRVAAEYGFRSREGEVRLGLDYTAGAAEHMPWEGDDRLGLDPDLHLYYRSDEWWDRVASSQRGFDRVHDYRFTVTDPAWRSVFDGSEELTALVAVPAAVRDVEDLSSSETPRPG